MRLAQIILGGFFFRPHARRKFEPRDRVYCFARAQQVDAQQKIGEVVLWLPLSRTLQHRECLGESRLLVEVEALLKQRVELLPVGSAFATLLRPRRYAYCKHQPQPETKMKPG